MRDTAVAGSPARDIAHRNGVELHLVVAVAQVDPIRLLAGFGYTVKLPSGCY